MIDSNTLPPSMHPSVRGVPSSTGQGKLPQSQPLTNTNLAASLPTFSSREMLEIQNKVRQEMKAWTTYLDSIRQLHSVRLVLMERERLPVPRIWTIIDAPPFDLEYRKAIYLAQQGAMAQVESPVVTFRLINVRELEADLDGVLPPKYTVLYPR